MNALQQDIAVDLRNNELYCDQLPYIRQSDFIGYMRNHILFIKKIIREQNWDIF